MIPTLALLAVSFLQPDIFTAEFGLQPDSDYTYLVREYRESEGRVTRDSPGQITLRYHPAQGQPDTLTVTIGLPDGAVTQPQATQLGLTLDDFRTVAIYELDNNYELTRLTNWEELRDQGIKVARAMFDARVQTGQVPREAADRAIQAVAEMFATHDGTFAIYAKRFAPYLMGYSWQLAENEEIVQETQIVTPFLDAPAPSILVTALADDPSTPGLIEYTMTQTIESKHFAKILEGVFDQLAEEPDAELQALIDAAEVSIRTDWHYNLDAQFITFAETTSTFNFPGQASGLERWTWTLIESPDP